MIDEFINCEESMKMLITLLLPQWCFVTSGGSTQIVPLCTNTITCVSIACKVYDRCINVYITLKLQLILIVFYYFIYCGLVCDQ